MSCCGWHAPPSQHAGELHSHPSAFGAALLQSRQPAWHPEYVQLVPEHPGPVLCTVSHATPQLLQFVVVLSGVSHPFRSGAVGWQSPKPGLHV